MNTKLTLTAGVVALAAGAALWRTAAPHPPAIEVAAAPDLSRAAAMPRSAAAAARPATLVVYVAGEVARPGVYALPPGSRTDAAVRAAGGVKTTADLVAINLAAPLADGEEVAVPGLAVPGSASWPSLRANQAGGHHHRKGRRRKHPPAAPLDLNAADAAALSTLPGIGPGLAERIVAYRGLNGRFASVDDLLDVAGMTDARLQKIAPYLAAR
jgi:competence protein ComEA